MFNMENIGRKISSARKAQNMTQMDLADSLNISFQAISNWERGISMPDISKLPEISKILHISIDDLLGKSSSLINGLLSEEGDAYLQNAEISSEELIEAAPILKPSQFNEAYKKGDLSADLSELCALLPYLDDETLELMAQKAYAEQGVSGLQYLAPFLSDSTIDSFAQDAASKNDPGAIASIAPFMSQTAIDRIVKDCAASQGLNAVTSLLPFASGNILKQMLYGKYL